MNFYDNGEYTPSSLGTTNQSLPSSASIGWQIEDESLVWIKVVMRTEITATLVEFIQIFP